MSLKEFFCVTLKQCAIVFCCVFVCNWLVGAEKKFVYGDGEADGRKSIAGSGEMIKFSFSTEKNKIQGVRIHGSRYGSPKAPKQKFSVYILNEDFSKVLHTEIASYRLFKRGDAKWVKVKFKKTIKVPKVFWVVLDFKAQKTNGVYVSFDTSTKGVYSKEGLPGEEIKDAGLDGDWMISLISRDKKLSENLIYEVKKEEKIVVLKYGDGEADAKKSIANNGEMIKFSLPVKKGKLKGIKIHGSRYGHPDASKEKFLLYVLNEDLSDLYTESVSYELFARGEAKWVTIELQKEFDLPKDFWIVLDFNAQRTKGVYVSVDTSTKGIHSKTGLPNAKVRDVATGGDWMIQALVIEEESSED